MIRIIFLVGFLVSSLLMLSSFVIQDESQDLPKEKKTEKHIKLIKLDDEGSRMELDTVIKNDGVFVWDGDTIDSENDWHWILKENLTLDSLHEKFDFHFDKDEIGGNFVMKSRNDFAPIIHEYSFDDKFPTRPPHPPIPPEIMEFGKERNTNVIDLSDPGIVSFKKTKKKNGMEKITIIRKMPDKKEKEILKEVIIHNGDHIPTPHVRIPGKKHTVKIIKENDGTEIIEENGKVIKIRKETKGDEKEIEVKVEVNEKEE